VPAAPIHAAAVSGAMPGGSGVRGGGEVRGAGIGCREKSLR